MSRLNPNARAFPPKCGRPGVTTKACATSHAENTPVCALKEIDLTHSLTPTATSDEVNNGWARNQLVPSSTAPHYGHNWTTTFPPAKTLECSGNLRFLGPQPSPKPVHRRSPSFPPPTSLARDCGRLNLVHKPVPSHPMKRHPSLSHATHSNPATHSARSTHPGYAGKGDLHDWYLPRSGCFYPFAEEDACDAALLQEAMNSRHATYRAYPTSPGPLVTDHSGSVFSDDDDELTQSRNVYIPNPSPYMTKEALQKYGQNFGRVVSVKVESSDKEVPYDIISQFPLKGGYDGRRYAFVMFDSNPAAAKFIDGLAVRGISAIFGRETAHLKHQALQDPHSSNCYFADIPLEFTEQDMRNLVYPARIASIRFLLDSNGNRRGTAMVRLESRHQAEEVISRLDLKYKPIGYSKCIQVRIADSENQKMFKQSRSRTGNQNGSSGVFVGSSPSSQVSRSSSFSSGGGRGCSHPSHDGEARLLNTQQMATQLQERLMQQCLHNGNTEWVYRVHSH
ncbi:hypothetical protein CspeluHIS016_0104710 [Cutaneotrichosporon spelunceum]|uniref:RRM domain-containing protein n=1 Tax=Cutaneotrichosporon spelunceum TaxID=1672016 RepID=A0AAD3Y7V5_9TREE|nr:hypothetical protein CspeluHIS016_0104710 [Cutaneotrichosporon spelunceum]